MVDVVQREMERPAYATAAVVTDGTNATLVTITVKNANGKPTGPYNFDLWLSDSTTGALLTATTASGAVQGKTNGTTGTDLATYVAKKALYVQCLANGTYQLSITDTAKTAFKLWALIGDFPCLVTTLAAASYG
jgi:hypothetical protein